MARSHYNIEVLASYRNPSETRLRFDGLELVLGRTAHLVSVVDIGVNPSGTGRLLAAMRVFSESPLESLEHAEDALEPLTPDSLQSHRAGIAVVQYRTYPDRSPTLTVIGQRPDAQNRLPESMAEPVQYCVYGTLHAMRSYIDNLAGGGNLPTS